MRVQFLSGIYCLFWLSFACAEDYRTIDQVFPELSEVSQNLAFNLSTPDPEELTAEVVNGIISIHDNWHWRQLELRSFHGCLLENNESRGSGVVRSFYRLKRSAITYASLTPKQKLLSYWGELYAQCSDPQQLASVLGHLGCLAEPVSGEIKRNCDLLQLATKENRVSCHHKPASSQLTWLDFTGCQIIPDEGTQAQVLFEFALLAWSFLLKKYLGSQWWIIALI